ncbi:hypothetical protein FIBSPDRAFT_1054584 [Athelia psychrophila]|uniref:Nephrocystin 3-like N-terminal domain-containing protein n=1 Tax=Athelia psychrophila TaxID=1759441 RepID=A0A167V3B9_9AGAM|nr:hypothetical protein FIBSPDRAFT_1054584 [Fibularhizoctonia sp. CBS 109695]
MSPPVAYTFKIISANDLPVRRVKLLGERNVTAKATVEGRSVETKVCMCSSSAEWEETFEIKARKTSSVMSLQLSGSKHGTSLNCGSDITISDLLQLCRYGKDAELHLRGIKSGLQGRIKIHLSLTSSGSWIDDEAQRWALVLSQQPSTAIATMRGCIDSDGIDGLLAKTMASQYIANVLNKLSHFMGIADNVAKVHPYAKLAWDVLSAAHKIIVAQVAIDRSVTDLANTMQDVYGFVDAIKAVPSKIQHLENIIQQIFNQTAECGRFIQEYLGYGFAGRLLKETMGASTPAKVAAMAQSLLTLRGQFDTGVSVQNAIVCFRIQTDVTTLLKNQTLDRLGSSGVSLASRSRCHLNTRRDIIDEILEWALLPSKGDNSNIFYLHGVAGIGKSTVAATVATHFSNMNRLGAFVGFDRASPEQIQPSTAVKALALQMATRDKRLIASIVEVINDDDTKDKVLDALLPEQFDRLIVKPLASIPALSSEGPIIIVLDGLYDCGQPNDWVSFLQVLVDQTESLPSNLRFIITSRTVNGIHDAVTSTALHPRIKSRELRSSSHSDISAYFTFRMQQIRRKNTYLQEDWQGLTAIAELTARAFGFFPWAVSASNFLDGHCPPKRLQSLLLQPLTSIPDLNAPLDELYRAALNSAGDWADADFVKDFRAIMGAIIESPAAISPTAIIRLLDCPLSFEPPVIVTMRRLGSVLSYGPVVQVLHPSFLDFLSSRERCGRDVNWYFELGPVRYGVSAGPATLCLQRMNTGLKRNMCDMTLSARLTTEVLPEELAYACESWVDHICTDETFESREMEKLMVVFLHGHLLHWFEAMSLLKKSEQIVPLLQRVATWLEENTFEDKSLGNLLIEAINFARKFAADIAGHPLHAYYTALPFCPSHSILYQLFHDSLVDPSVLLVLPQGLVGISAEPAILCLRIMNGGLKRNICDMLVSACLTTEVLPEVLAYACQSWVGHICTNEIFKSREMEKLMVVFLHGHLLHWFEAMSILKKTEEIVPMLQRVATWLKENIIEDKSLKDLVIEAIDFARKFAADIADHPLYVYYMALPLFSTHSILYRLFHEALVDPSVLLVPLDKEIDIMAFSADSLQLVTGYTDLTVWDTATGGKLLTIESPVGCHPFSAAFSYDGSRIACGTQLASVYVCDSMSGAQVIGPLNHSGSNEVVIAVAWSMDGERLLSGCRTGEVILWNIALPKGNRCVTKIHHPGCSKMQPLRSVASSSDGSLIASCSKQGDIYVWNSKTGGIMWSVQDPQWSDPGISVKFLTRNMGAFLLVQMKECTQARDASTGDLCPLPDSIAGAVGLTRGDFMVNLLIESIAKHHPITNRESHSTWAAQGEYFAFQEARDQCHVVHLPSSNLM